MCNVLQEKEFYQKLSQALRLDSATAKVLAGEFARDALLGRAEQLARHEVRYNYYYYNPEIAPPDIFLGSCHMTAVHHM